MAAKKSVKTKPVSLKPKVTAPAPVKTAPKKVVKAAAPTFYNEAGKPDPNGLYDRDGYMVKVPGKAPKVTRTADARTEEEIRAARRAGYLR